MIKIIIFAVMNTTDIIILVILGIALIKGLKDGLVRQIGGIVGLILGIYLAYKFSDLLSGWLNQWINASESIVKIISFSVIIIGVVLCMSLLGRLLEKIFQLTTLGWVNRVLGVLFSLFAAILIIGVLASLLTYVNEEWFTLIPENQFSDSKLIEPITKISDTIFPYLKKLFTNSPIHFS